MQNRKFFVALLAIIVLFLGVFTFAQTTGNNEEEKIIDENETIKKEIPLDEEKEEEPIEEELGDENQIIPSRTQTYVDVTAPIITISNYITTPTNQDIVVTATTNEGTLNRTSYTFTDNGSFTFVAIDAAGNSSEKEVVITNIDKTAPVITIGEYITTPTNQDIIVNASTNEGTLNTDTHLFTENGSFFFIAVDVAGNISLEMVTINNIDKTAPVITIGDYVTTPINQDVVVSATTNEGTLNQTSYIFIENGSFDFIATDAAGNVTTKTVTVDNIDKTAPESPLLVAPLDGASVKGNSITNSWTSVPDAVKYIYESYHNVTATSLRHRQTVNAPNYSKTATNIGDGIFWWRVKSVDAAGNESAWSNLRKVTVDSTKPVITLNGDTEVTVEVNTTYNDAGVNVTDNYDTGLIALVNSTVDMSVLGTYTVKYNVTDSAGNIANEVTRTVHVVDTTKPVITKKVAADIYLEIGSELPAIADLVTAIDNYDGNITNKVYILKNPNMNVLGTYLVEFYAIDSSNNRGYTPLRVHVVDTTKPVISLNGGDMEIVLGESFTDPGVASVSDNYATLTLENVIKTGSVNVNVEGTYELNYSITDGFNTTNIKRKVIVKPLIKQLSVYNPNEETKYNGFNISFNRDFVVNDPSQIKIQYEYSIEGGSYVLANLVKYPGKVSSNSTYAQEEYSSLKDFIFTNKTTTFYGMLNANGGKILYKKSWIGIESFQADTISKDVVISMQEHNVQDRLRTAYNAVQSGKTVLIRTVLTFKLENGASVTYKLDPIKYN